MSAESTGRPALIFSAFVAAGILVLGLQLAKTASALDTLDERILAIKPVNGTAGAGGSGSAHPGGSGGDRREAWKTQLRELDDEMTRTSRELDGRRPVRASGGAHGEVSAANLGQAVEEVLSVMRREKIEQMALSLSKAMRGGGVHTMEMNSKVLDLTDDQLKQMTKVFDEESERCRVLLLNTNHHDADYQAQAGEIIDRTEARLAEIMTPEQRKKFNKMGADFFGPGLDYERKAKPK